VVLIVFVIGAVCGLIYVIHQPRNVEKFTEFYILNDAGKVENYPGTIIAGQSTTVILGVINHENDATTYRIEITLGGKKYQQIEPFSLNAEEKQEQPVTVTPTQTGNNRNWSFCCIRVATQMSTKVCTCGLMSSLKQCASIDRSRM
jgi:uncharacterized membrane protein